MVLLENQKSNDSKAGGNVGVLVGVLIILVIILVTYIVLIQQQLRNINHQLCKRLTEYTRQPVSLEMINKDLNELTVNINKCLKVEETLRLKGIREDKKFRELIANISHDLRTPLTVIKGYQQFLEKGELTDTQAEKLKIAMKHTEELGELIDRFFEYSYLVNVETEVNMDRINLTNILTECIVASIPTLEERNLKVHFEETKPIFVMADKEMLIRIIQNLIRNCVQHSNGEIEVQLHVTDNAIISFKNPVKDVGELNVTRIFDRFYTSDMSRSKQAGLGLAIVKLLAEQMGGRVEAVLQNKLLDIRVSLPLKKDKRDKL